MVEQYVSKDKGGYVVMDISQTNQKMASAKRGMFMLPGREQLLVQDEIELKSPGDVWWFMHTRTDVTLSTDRRSATLTYGGKTLNAAIVSPDSSLTFGVMDALPLEGSPVVDGQNQNKGFRKLYINGKDKKTFEVAVVFTPLPDPGIQPELPDWPAHGAVGGSRRAHARGGQNPSDRHQPRRSAPWRASISSRTAIRSS